MLQTAILPHSETLGRYQGNAYPPIKLSKSDKRPVPDGSTTESSTLYRTWQGPSRTGSSTGARVVVLRKFSIVHAVPGCP